MQKLCFPLFPESVIGQVCVGTQSVYSGRSLIVKLREFLCPL